MSDSRTGRSPRSMDEWFREQQQRTRRLEDSASVRIGSWVISEQGGELVATKPGRLVPLTAITAAEVAATTKRSIVTITATGDPTGVWRLIYRDALTADLTVNEQAADILQAILALSPDYTVLDFDVTGPNGGPWRLAYPGGTLDVDATDLSDGTFVIT